MFDEESQQNNGFLERFARPNEVEVEELLAGSDIDQIVNYIDFEHLID